MVFGFVVVVALLPLTRLWGRLFAPDRIGAVYDRAEG